MELVLAASTAYRVGEYTALLALLVLLVWCVRRAINAPLRTAVDGSALARSSAADTPAATSVAPPGFADGPVVTVPSVPTGGPFDAPQRGGRLRYAAGACVAAALFVVGVLGVVNNGSPDPWATQAGIDVKAGFLDGCARTADGVVDCQCAFAHLTSQAPYNTPQGFESLAGAVQTFEQTGNRSAIPAVYLSSLQACRLTN